MHKHSRAFSGLTLSKIFNDLRNIVNDLRNASIILDFPMFSDNTNVPLPCQNINKRCQKLRGEPKNIGQSFKVNKLSLNNKKTDHTLFYKESAK